MSYRELKDNNELPAEPLATVEGPVDGNVFSVIGAVKRALQRAGYREEAAKFADQAMNKADSYDDVLAIAQEYVNFEL